MNKIIIKYNNIIGRFKSKKVQGSISKCMDQNIKCMD